METTQRTNPKIRKLIVVLSIAIPVVVAILFKVKIPGYDFSILPPIYAGINALTAFLLIVALVAIKMKKIALHESIIKACMGLSVLFLLCYVAYHMTSDSTLYGDIDGSGVLEAAEVKLLSSFGRMGYYMILITHILLSIVVIPLVLFTYLHAWEGNFEKHRKWTKITWPIWFYVASTGVIVYFMISPYYR